jgi:hypothetical protein
VPYDQRQEDRDEQAWQLTSEEAVPFDLAALAGFGRETTPHPQPEGQEWGGEMGNEPGA